jgi:hypothetical protein
MNYFAQGIQQGADIGARSYLEKKKRDQEALLNKARLDFEANQLREQFKGQGGLQELRQKFEAEQGGLTRTFQGGENEKSRAFSTDQLNKTQTFQGGENQKSRDYGREERVATQGFQSGERDKDRKLSESEAAARLFLDAQRFKEGGEQFDQKFSWEKDPTNPDNKQKLAHTDYLMRDVQPPPLPNATTALQNGRKASAPGELPTLTPAEAATAKPGTRYKTTDGRILTR